MSRERRPWALIAGAALLLGACGAGGDVGVETLEPVTDPPGATLPQPDEGSATSTTESSASQDDLGVGRWPVPLANLDPDAPAAWTVEVISTSPHDAEAFTQGLELLEDGRLIESTGRRGESDVRIVDPASGDIELLVPLEDEEFGEGLTVVDDTVIQLTFEEEIARRWSLPGLDPLGSFTYSGEGWGLCLLGDRLAMTDGTSLLRWRDPNTFAIVEEVAVRRVDQPIVQLNELECLDGHVVANIWKSSDMVVIRPDGAVVATIDGSELVARIGSGNPDTEVLNGIAAHPDGTFSLTGKLWPTRFQVRVVAA